MKRKGSISVYLEPWHADILEFLDLRKNQGIEELRARDLFLAMWINDLFMERVDLDLDWSLMCPHECSGLTEVFGDEFRELYTKYEKQGKYKKIVKARDIWGKILDSQIETGTPYMLYKDAINMKSNQSNIGIIRSSNLCLDQDTVVKCRIDGVELDITMFDLDELFKLGNKIEVYSRDTDTGIDEWCLVENSAMTNKDAETIKITDDSGNFIICTNDHLVWTENRGYVRAIDLFKTDVLKINKTDVSTVGLISIEKVENRPVYDITVRKNNNFYANNILVHNCAEILEASGITKSQKEILNDKELLDKLKLSEFYGLESVNETAVCNLASIALPKFINKNKTYNFNKLMDISYNVTINLNNVIDVNYYPTPATKFSNLCHRPIAIGVQGLADVFFKMNLNYDSVEAKQLNKDIFETIYYGALKASIDLAKIDGHYSTFVGSPLEKGIFQFDMWGVTPSNRWDWNKMRADIKQYGVRNSLLLATMPTASCQISSTKIQTSNGIRSYQEIMNDMNINWSEIEKTNEQGWLVFKEPLYVNTRFGVKKSEKIFYNGHAETLDIEMEDGSVFTCSENHMFLVNRENKEEWVRADELKDNDAVNKIDSSLKIKRISKNGIKPTWDIEVNDVHEYLLENGCVSHNTSSILGNEAGTEAQTSNMYTRGVLSGTFIIVNKYLVKDLIKAGLWSENMRKKIIQNNGSVQNIAEIPDSIKEMYRTVYEIKQKDIIDMASDRGAFIDQTQSMNIFMDNPNFAKLTAMHFYGWGRRSLMTDSDGKVIIPTGDGIEITYDSDNNPRFYRDKKFNLKTGMYYLRSKGASDAIKFTVQEESKKEQIDSQISCSLDSPEDCEACGS